MCEPLPGPRCSGYMRTKLQDAHEALGAAKETAGQDAAAFQGIVAEQTTDPQAAGGSRSRIRAEAAAYRSQQAYVAAEDAHRDALHEYETTPEGQKNLAQTAAILSLSGDDAGADRARARLQKAQAERANQKQDLVAAVRIKERLRQGSTGAEGALMMNAELAERQAVLELDEATGEHRAAVKAETEARKPYDQAMKELAAANGRVQEFDTACRSQTMAARSTAKQVYVEAGVTPRMADYYTQDMVESAARPPRGGTGQTGDGSPTTGLSMKVKPNGTDKDKTQAAADAVKAAESRPINLEAGPDGTAASAFVHANAKLALLTSQREVERDNVERAARAGGPSINGNQEARQTVARARYRMEDAERAVEKTTAEAARTRAQIGAGAGPAARTVDWHQAADEVRRNPDGSLNAYVYSPPSLGFPDGRYKQAHGVTTIGAARSGSGLVLEDGTVAARQERWRRAANGGDTVSMPAPGVLIAPAHPGSTPITDELDYPSFSVIHDSSD